MDLILTKSTYFRNGKKTRSYLTKHCFIEYDRLFVSNPIRRNSVSTYRTFSKIQRSILTKHPVVVSDLILRRSLLNHSSFEGDLDGQKDVASHEGRTHIVLRVLLTIQRFIRDNNVISRSAFFSRILDAIRSKISSSRKSRSSCNP